MLKPLTVSEGTPETPSKSREMDLQQLLLTIDNSLCKDEVKALAFLCSDLLDRKSDMVSSAQDIFSGLVDRGLLTKENHQVLTELLITIRRYRLVLDLGLSDETSPSSSFISPYRKLLHDLSLEIADKELKRIKFLLYNTIPRKMLDESETTLDVFLVMERMNLINPCDLSKLETLLDQVYPALKKKINIFKTQLCKEVGRPRANTYPVEPQISPSVVKPELPARNGVMETFSNQKSESSLIRETPHNKNTGGLETYPMTAAKRGVCLLINNFDFTPSAGSLTQREGTQQDEISLRAVFEWLGFEMQVYNDCNKGQMLSLLRDLSKKDHSRVDCLACCIFSHGQEGTVFGVEGDAIGLSELMDPFNGINCPSLVDKPKMFFIQACQGNRAQKPVDLEADGSASSSLASDARGIPSIPAGADFLLAMATVPSFVSFRERGRGTWFIQSLCQNLIQMVPSGCDLVSILTKVNADVSLKSGFGGTKKQMPQPTLSLRKKVIFPVPSEPPPSLKQ